MVLRSTATAVVSALVMAACAGDADPGPRAIRTPTPTVSESPAERTRSVKLPKIDNRATGMARARLARAIKDVRATRYWRRLTKDIYAVSMGSRPGRQYVPEDGHLAEARAFPYVDEDGGGRLCDITFFPTAIRDDMRLQSRYFEQGLLERGPPTVRNFWAAILGHELAHCLPHEREGLPALSPERVARRWEKKILAAVEGRRPKS